MELSFSSSVENTEDSSSSQSTMNSPSDSEQLFMRNLKNVWNQCRKCSAVHSMIHSYFDSVSNAYEHALTLVRLSPDYNPSKVLSLSFTIMEQFALWVQPKEQSIKHLLTRPVKFEAFQVASRQKHKALSSTVIDIYKLKVDRHIFLQSLNDMLHIHMYKEVAEWSHLLGLDDQFGIYEFLIPLLFQDKLTVVEHFIKKSASHHLELVKFLDSILGESNKHSFVSKVILDLNIPDTKQNTLVKYTQSKSLCKLIKRFAEMHKIPSDVTPNMITYNGIKTVYFLIHKRYLDGSLGKEGFRELVIDVCGSNHEIQWHLIMRLAESDPKEGLYWAKLLNMSPEEMPCNIRDLYESGYCESPQSDEQQICDTTDSADSNAEDEKAIYYSLSLPISSIVIVDTEAKFALLIESAVDGATIVGLDSEWKPTMHNISSGLSLMQLATESKVYLIDVISLASFDHLWQEFAVVFLANPTITKIGFSLGSDFNAMKQYLPIGNTNLVPGHGFLDLVSVWNRLVRDYNFEFPFKVLFCTIESERCSSSGLSQLVALCLGKPLNKNEQFSNWQIRPLRHTQVVYAALDAFCLIQIYSVLSSLCDKRNIPFFDIIQQIMSSSWKQAKTKKSRANNIKHPKTQNAVINEEPVDVSWLKVLCDNGLYSLGRQLRRCGVDCYIAASQMSFNELVKISKEEGRYLLAAPAVYAKVCGQMQERRGFKVESKHADNQLLEVLNHFNVIVRKEDLLSRCQSCNGTNIIALPAEFIKLQMNVTKKTSVPCVPAGFEDDDDDWLSGESSYSTEEEKFVTEVTLFKTPNGIPVKLDKITDAVLNTVMEFYVCDNCGDCYWDGGYFDKVLGSHNSLCA